MNTIIFIKKYYTKMVKTIIKKILNTNPIDTDTILNLKKKFIHNQRGFNYGLIRRFVDCLYCHATPGTIETTIEIISKYPNGGKLLNLGGGTGQVANIFKELGYDVYNLDIDIKKIDENDKNINFDLNSGDKFPFEEKSFDIVVCQEIIEHIESPWKLFRDVKSMIKSDGIFILSTPNISSMQSRLKFLFTGYFSWFTPDSRDYHINPLPHWEILLIADKTGFEKGQLFGSGDYFYKKTNTSDKKTILKNEGLIYSFKLR